MAEGARLAIPYPEVGVVDEPTLAAQSDALAATLSARPVVLGGCCCSHVGAARGLAGRVDRLGIVWIDAHGDLNTPETSPSGNLWGMALRMLLDDGVVRHADAALVGARNLDPPEAEFVAETGIDDSLERALAAVGAAYVALDLDVLDPAEADVFFAEPDGLRIDEVEAVLRETTARARVAGIGVSGFRTSERNVAVITRLLGAAGF
ncbi:MAG TPA: arginase family protein [Gaiellaceae bacterium]|nr:arginase family protein [Gaiellaceae bacterium]